jgi:hypothetical protein
MQENQQRKSTFAWVGLVVMTLATGAFGFLYFDQKNVATEREATIMEKAKELVFTQTKLDSVSAALDAKIGEVKALGGNIEELMQVKARLETDKAALLKGNRVEIGKYTAKIKEYEAFLAQKDEEIVKLRGENEVLLTTNQTLNTENTTLKTDRETLAKDKQLLTDSVSTYANKNKELADKVTIGAALRAQNVRVLAINKRGKEKEDEKHKAKRVEKIKVVFTLPQNELTKQEDKEIVMRLLDTDGSVVAHDPVNSKFILKGQEIAYTAKERVPFTNNNQFVEMIYDNTERFKPGSYNVELYAEGFKIGTGNFIIK